MAKARQKHSGTIQEKAYPKAGKSSRAICFIAEYAELLQNKIKKRGLSLSLQSE